MSIQSDLKWLRENVVTKADLSKFKKQVNLRFNKLDKKSTDLFNFLDKEVVSKEKRLKTIEKHLGITPDPPNYN